MRRRRCRGRRAAAPALRPVGRRTQRRSAIRRPLIRTHGADVSGPRRSSVWPSPGDRRRSLRRMIGVDAAGTAARPAGALLTDESTSTSGGSCSWRVSPAASMLDGVHLAGACERVWGPRSPVRLPATTRGTEPGSTSGPHWPSTQSPPSGLRVSEFADRDECQSAPTRPGTPGLAEAPRAGQLGLAPDPRSVGVRTLERRLEPRTRRADTPRGCPSTSTNGSRASRGCRSPSTETPMVSFGYLFESRRAPPAYRPALAVDISEWDDPDYEFLAFVGRDRPFTKRECGGEPGESVDKARARRALAAPHRTGRRPRCATGCWMLGRRSPFERTSRTWASPSRSSTSSTSACT